MEGLSKVENILQSIIDGKEYTGIPLSRVEKLLMQVAQLIEEGGGGGGGDIEPDDELTDADIDDIMSVISTDNDD